MRRPAWRASARACRALPERSVGTAGMPRACARPAPRDAAAAVPTAASLPCPPLPPAPGLPLPLPPPRRHLHIPLVQAERAWAYAMDLKSELEEKAEGGSLAAKRQHLTRRLAKAARHAGELAALASQRCDARTQVGLGLAHDC